MLAAWDAPLLDCHGQPETEVSSLIEWGLKELLRWDPCPRPDDPAAVCPVYSPVSFMAMATLPGSGPQIYLMPPDPPLNGIAFLRVTILDAVGNPDTETCR